MALKESKEEKIEEKMEKVSPAEGEEKRKLVIPGEVVVSGDEYLPGEGTRKEGQDIIASKYGLADISGRLVRIIPLSGSYFPRYGNTIIGKVTDLTFNGWLIDIESPYSAFLSIIEVPRFISKENLADFLDIGDIIACKVTNVKRKNVDLTIHAKGLGKLEGGMIMKINSNKVPRVIGKEGSMIKLIKQETNSEIIVGQNGLVWIKAESIENELKAKEAILFVVSRSYIEGLTEKVKEFLEAGKI
jgi:exosome complex component RRP4